MVNAICMYLLSCHNIMTTFLILCFSPFIDAPYATYSYETFLSELSFLGDLKPSYRQNNIKMWSKCYFWSMFVDTLSNHGHGTMHSIMGLISWRTLKHTSIVRRADAGIIINAIHTRWVILAVVVFAVVRIYLTPLTFKSRRACTAEIYVNQLLPFTF